MSKIRIDQDCIFIIVTDLHLWSKNIANRKNYTKECIYNMTQLQIVVKKVLQKKKPSQKVYIVFLGDVFHHGEPSPTEYNNWVQVFTVLRALVNGMFAVVGNHEITYEVDNPFWGLVSEIKSPQLLRRGLQPKGSLPIINLVDHIDVFDTRLHFNHFNTNIYDVVPTENILFAHNYWATEGILKSYEKQLDEKALKRYSKGSIITETSPIRFFKHCFFGHNHLIYGDFQVGWKSDIYDDTQLHYLGSFGLTKRNEVLKSGGYRKFAILTVNQNGSSLEFEEVKLIGSRDVLDRETIAEIESIKKLEEEIEIEINSCILDDLDPIENLRQKYINMPELSQMLEALLEGDIPAWLKLV